MQSVDHPGPGDSRRAGGATAPGLILHFPAGARPDIDDVAALARDFALTHRPADEADPAELTMAGLAFRALGLAPGAAARVSPPRHAFDTVLLRFARTEAVRIVPVGGEATARSAPVLRMLVALGTALSGLPALSGVGWDAAGTVMSPDHFRRVGQAWLDGGAFPGLGLAALVRDEDRVRSEGLALFTGHELAVSLAAGESPAGAAKLALRAMHGLVERECVATDLPDYLGKPRLAVSISGDGRLLLLG